MEELQQAREGLRVYLQANRQYIQEKVYNEFNVECIEKRTLETLDADKMAKAIKEIFDFGDNQIYDYFFKHLKSNIQQYIKEQYKAKAVKSYYVLDIEKLTDIVKYCITHGFDQNAAKPKNTVTTANKSIPPQQINQVKKEKASKDQFEHVKSKVISFIDPSNFISQKKEFKLERYEMPQRKQKARVQTFLDISKLPEKKQFKIEKYSMPEINVLPRYLASKPKPQLIIHAEQPLPVAKPIDQSYLLLHKKAIRERLLKLFNFYCIQQQNIGQRPTFDRIKNQGQSMNLGAFMQFCQYTQLFKTKEMTKDVLIAQFKNIAEGSVEIKFEVFQQLLIHLDQKYLKIVGHDPQKNPMPTYEARLMLNQPAKLGELKKHRNLIFGTRSMQGRERSLNSEIRYGNKELTAHSGKFSSDLELFIKEKSHHQEGKEHPKTSRPKKTDGPVNLADLHRLKLPKLNWIEDDDDEDIKKILEKKL